MVKEIHETKFLCPYCNCKYDNYDDARSCAIGCLTEDIDDIEEEENDEYMCEFCNETFKNDEKAIRCETKHKKNKDKFYEQFYEELNRKKLLEAGNHTHQKKLLEVLEWI